MPEADEPLDFIQEQLKKYIGKGQSGSSVSRQESLDEGYESDTDYNGK
jgi:hypothetical protein